MEKLRSLFEFSLYRIFAVLIRFFPRKIILLLGNETGRLLFHLGRKHRRIALKNLYTALGKDKTPSEIENIAKLSFQYFGKAFLDMIYLAQLKPEKRNSYLITDGLKNLQTALDKGKGVLLLSAHFGLWEILSAILSKASS
jgi:KDO2-lipid IV(A) lauroyltransferase